MISTVPCGGGADLAKPRSGTSHLRGGIEVWADGAPRSISPFAWLVSMPRRICLLAVASLVATPAVGQPGSERLRAALDAARHDAETREVDQFTLATVDETIAGMPFSLSLPIAGGAGSYSYDNGRLRLRFSYDTRPVGMLNLAERNLVVLGTRTRPSRG